MPLYHAIIEGQKIQCAFDGESHQLDFHRSLCLEAECLDSASDKAIQHVLMELSELPDIRVDIQSGQTIHLGHIERLDELDRQCRELDFIWYFPDDAVFSHKLK